MDTLELLSSHADALRPLWQKAGAFELVNAPEVRALPIESVRVLIDAYNRLGAEHDAKYTAANQPRP